MATLFTSDHHFHHKNILKYQPNRWLLYESVIWTPEEEQQFREDPNHPDYVSPECKEVDKLLNKLFSGGVNEIKRLLPYKKKKE